MAAQVAIPADLLVGVVPEIDPVSAQGAKTARIDQLVNFFQSKIVEVRL